MATLYIETFHHICYALLSSHAYIRNILQSHFIHLRIQLYFFRGIVQHINNVARKIDYALYGLSKVSKQLSFTNKKLLYSGLIHSHLGYGLPIWGFSTQGRQNVLLQSKKKQYVKSSIYLTDSIPYHISMKQAYCACPN